MLQKSVHFVRKLRKLKVKTKDFNYSRCALLTRHFLIPYIRNNSQISYHFYLFCICQSFNTMFYRCSIYMTSDQRDCACEGNKYYFSFLTVKNLQRILPIGQFSFSKFSTLNLTGVEEATFSRKNMPVDRISLFHSFGEATSNHCALCSPVISEASLLLRKQRDSQCCPQYMGISSLSLTGGRDYRNYRPHSIASSGNQTELRFWRQVYNCISQSHLQLLQTHRAYQVEEVILPSHMWDLCSVTCPSPTPKAIR